MPRPSRPNPELWLLLCAACLTAACGSGRSEPPRSRGVKPAPPARAAPGVFEDATRRCGLDFVHFGGAAGEFYFPEIAGAGAALLDYDGDGDLDLYLAQGHLLGAGKSLRQALFVPAPKFERGGRLYRNDLESSAHGRRLRFTDVTDSSGLRAFGYGMGAAAGDYDNDGWTDLFLANFGADQMWRNRGDGRFEEVTARTGTSDPLWSTSASFVDIDRDGWLDLYVANYVDFRLDSNKICRSPSGRRDYCGPNSYRGESDRLYRNLGGGRFADATVQLGIAAASGSGLGVVSADFDADGWPDIYVANDLEVNFLWMNQGGGHFREDALLRGAALSGDGRAQASMGVVAADLDADGDQDLFMTHLLRDYNTLYLNRGAGFFEDRSNASGLGAPSLAFTGFGAAALDFDRDGRLDLLAVNGGVHLMEQQARAGDPFPFKQTKQLFRNRGDGRFDDVSSQAGAVFAIPEVSRGLAIGDLDNDGDSDAILCNNSGPARVLLNVHQNNHHWLGLRLLGRQGRDAYGALVTVAREGAPPLRRRVQADGSYLSSSDPRVLVGLASQDRVPWVRVDWPDGDTETWRGLQIDRYQTLRQGEGERP